MENELKEIVFLLDNSGSMRGLETETMDEYNSLVENELKLNPNTIVTTVLFNKDLSFLNYRVKLENVQLLTEEDYKPKGKSALLDAIRKTMKKIEESYIKLNFENMPEKIVFYIVSDGLDNASMEYTYQDVEDEMSFVEDCYNWKFIFLGSDLPSLALKNGLSYRYDRAACFQFESEESELKYRKFIKYKLEIKKDLPDIPKWQLSVGRYTKDLNPK